MLTRDQYTSKNLRRLILMEEAAPLTALREESDLPSMVALRSPTTQTLIAIQQNSKGFGTLNDQLLDAEREGAEFQELTDEGEGLLANPLLPQPPSPEFLTPVTRSPTKRIEFGGDSATEGANAAASATSPPRDERRRYSGTQVRPSSALAGRPTADDDDETLLSRIVFTYPRDAAGDMIDPDGTIDSVARRKTDVAFKKANDHARDQFHALHAPIGELAATAGSSGSPPKSSSHGAPATSLAAMMAQQRADLVAADKRYADYTVDFGHACAEQARLRGRLQQLLDGR